MTVHDTELLRRCVVRASQDAFAELVDRHVDLAFTTALRRANGDRAGAVEATYSTGSFRSR